MTATLERHPMRHHNLTQTVHQFRAAAQTLIQPTHTTIQNQTHTAPSLYHQLCEAIPGQQGNGGHSARSMPPLWIDAIKTLHTIDHTVTQWLPLHNETTTTRLHCLIRLRHWKQHDTPTLHKAAAQLAAWTREINHHLTPQSIKTLTAPCPACQTTTVHRQDTAGETIRKPALEIIAGHGCTCLHCGAHWAPDHYLFLCQLVGFQLPEGVLE